MLGVATLVFALIHLVPGDPAQAMLGEGASQQDVLKRASLAHGSIPLASLGSRALDVTAGSTRTFSRSGYSGSRSGQLQLRLELARSRVYVVRG